MYNACDGMQNTTLCCHIDEYIYIKKGSYCNSCFDVCVYVCNTNKYHTLYLYLYILVHMYYYVLKLKYHLRQLNMYMLIYVCIYVMKYTQLHMSISIYTIRKISKKQIFIFPNKLKLYHN